MRPANPEARPMFPALLATAAVLSAPALPDFFPLAVGHKWEYTGDHPRTVEVTAETELPGGKGRDFKVRVAPTPANGDIRCAASPSRVTPHTRSQRCSIGSAWMRRTTGSVSLPETSAVNSGAQPSNSAATRARPAARPEKSMPAAQPSGLFNAAYRAEPRWRNDAP